MAQVTYVGRHSSGVFIPHGDVEFAVGHGETVELPDDLASKLAAEQPNAFRIESAGDGAESEED